MSPNLLANETLMRQAREALRGKWAGAVLGGLIFLVLQIAFGSIPVIGWICGLLLSGPFILGMNLFYLDIARGQTPNLNRLFSGFQVVMDAFLAYLLVVVLVILWCLLLVVPGILAAFSYSLTFYILGENPGMTASRAVAESKRLMYGNRWKLFCLGCRFIGWFLLCIVTAGIACIWVLPYFQVSTAQFYLDLKRGEK
jgi:uncharacterized membrane protein